MSDDEKRDIVERRNPFDVFGLSDLERAFRSMMRYPLEWTRRLEEGFRTPLSEMRVDEKTGDTIVTFELPGVSKDEIEITVTRSTLIIVAESETRKYKRIFSLSKEIEPTKVKASFNNGILEITLKTTDTKEGKGYKVRID